MSGLHKAVAQTGFSLLEVLIALLVLAVGVLGAVLLQSNALRYSASAADQTQASFIAHDLLDRLRANPAGMADYSVSVAGCTGAGPGPVASASIGAVDLADFAHAAGCLLPGGQGQVVIAGQQATVTLSWSEARIVADAGVASLTLSAMIRGQP